jgi:hypothetical protein
MGIREGAVLSGPFAMLLVTLTHPQPEWRDAQLFAAKFHAVLIGALTMANPSSLAWGLEMWGYGFLSVGTWQVAPPWSW